MQKGAPIWPRVACGGYAGWAVRTVAIINRKGGVGKTTTAVNLGAALALRGRRVLLVDCDPQANLSDHVGHGPESVEQSLYEVLVDGLDPTSLIRSTATERLDLLPAHPDLAAAEAELAAEIGRETRLRRALDQIDSDRYDWVLIDCPPSLGLLSLNAMVAAKELILTVQTEYFAMRGLGHVDEVIGMVQEHVNPELRILGILATLVNPVTRLSKEVLEEIRGHYGELVFKTKIRQNIRLAEAPGHQTHIFAYQPSSAGAEDYRSLAEEIEGGVVTADPPNNSATETATATDIDSDDAVDDAAISETDETAESEPAKKNKEEQESDSQELESETLSSENFPTEQHSLSDEDEHARFKTTDELVVDEPNTSEPAESDDIEGSDVEIGDVEISDDAIISELEEREKIGDTAEVDDDVNFEHIRDSEDSSTDANELVECEERADPIDHDHDAAEHAPVHDESDSSNPLDEAEGTNELAEVAESVPTLTEPMATDAVPRADEPRPPDEVEPNEVELNEVRTPGASNVFDASDLADKAQRSAQSRLDSFRAG